ncbi:MAG: excinuclease ABC subunit UvrC, partial [Bacteroidota bacterium]|nr:excinuclease ABC subunit UvrC [Bacteroidota bacterium]
MTAEEFQHISTTIPHKPGIYKYYDTSHQLLYVGKAKDLRKRVSSYFTKTFVGYKTLELVKRIKHIEFTIVDSEQDAFLLENALIKQYQPKYNINLKDDKTYPYIVIKKEPFPRVFLTRQKLSDGSEYLGPFSSVGRVRELLQLIKQYIPLRTCKLALTENNIQKQKFKVCLEYHLGNCKGPCEGLQTELDYNNGIQQIREILKGNLTPVMQRLKAEMQNHASNLAFEKAAMVKNKMNFLEDYQAKSVIVSTHLNNIDVFSIEKEGNVAFINYLMINHGTIVQTHTRKVEIQLDESEAELLPLIILDIRKTFNSFANEIVVPFEIVYPESGIIITIPKAGDKKKLLELSQKNVAYFKEELRKKQTLHLSTKSNTDLKQILEEMQQYLHLQELPSHIECFDNSNFQGSYPVSAMVCFKNGMPSKKDYRHFNVKTVSGINDFATMKEVVYRRYKRLKEENQPLPNLVIIDGGKGQLHAALDALQELDLMGKMNIIGLAKNEEEIFFPEDSHSL